MLTGWYGEGSRKSLGGREDSRRWHLMSQRPGECGMVQSHVCFDVMGAENIWEGKENGEQGQSGDLWLKGGQILCRIKKRRMGVTEKDGEGEKHRSRGSAGVGVLYLSKLNVTKSSSQSIKTNPGLKLRTQSEKLPSSYYSRQNMYCRVFLPHNIHNV